MADAVPAQTGNQPAADQKPNNSAVGVAAREANRRQDAVKSAQDLLTAAELDRSENRNADAIAKYLSAFQLVPNVPAARELREAIFNRYQKAAIAYAEELVAKAQWEEAQAALTNVTTLARDSGLPPSKMDPGLMAMIGRLKGEYYNKAMTPEHLDRVMLVDKALREAHSLVEIGDFDGARNRYHEVLNLDRYNQAARRGLEEVERHVMNYLEVARNHARAAQLGKVAEGWDLEPPPSSSFSVDVTVSGGAGLGTPQGTLREKLDRIVIPQIEFQDTPLRTVVEYLSQKAQELDTTTSDPNQRGLNIVIDTGGNGAAGVEEQPITIRLTNAPLDDVLRYVTGQVGMKYRVDQFAVSIVPQNAVDEDSLITRSYEVPPGFVTGGAGAGGGGGGAAPDPFAQPAPGAGAGTLVKRITAQEFLEQNGVSFPPGSVAQLTANSRLVVRNTAANIDLIESLILAAKEGGTKMVRVTYKMIAVTEKTLNEMGFDWLVGATNVDGANRVFAAGGTVGNQAGRAISDFPFNQGGAPIGNFPVTSGLRTGDATLPTLSIDDVIARDSPTSATSSAGPGVFALAGVFTDPQFQVVWRALAQREGIDRLCSASVVTKPGERATIRQVREFIYPTEYDPPEIPNQIGGTSFGIVGPGGVNASFSPGSVAVTPATPAAFETRELGKIVEAEPTIGADNLTVDLNISTDVSDFVGFINYGSPITASDNLFQGFFQLPNGQIVAGVIPLAYEVTENRILMPVFEAVRETTNVTIYDGSTLVIGGMLGEEIDKIQDKVPFLGDFPAVGRLFRSTLEERHKRALLLFATVRILDGSGRPVNDLSEFAAGSGATTAQAN